MSKEWTVNERMDLHVPGNDDGGTYENEEEQRSIGRIIFSEYHCFHDDYKGRGKKIWYTARTKHLETSASILVR